jgi:hypothetical protein
MAYNQNKETGYEITIYPLRVFSLILDSDEGFQ